MAARTILKHTKGPLLFFRSQLLAVAAVPKTNSPNPQLIQIQASNQNPVPHISDLRHYLYQPPSSPMLNGLAETLGRLQARGSDDDEDRGSDDDDEENDSGVEITDDEDSDFFDSDYEEDTSGPYY